MVWSPFFLCSDLHNGFFRLIFPVERVPLVRSQDDFRGKASKKEAVRRGIGVSPVAIRVGWMFVSVSVQSLYIRESPLLASPLPQSSHLYIRTSKRIP